MTEEEMITLMSLDDVAEATIIKNKLETEGIACFMNNKRGSIPSKTVDRRNIDIRVYLKDLDKALKMIADDEKG
jgi:putative signal transducing protein